MRITDKDRKKKKQSLPTKASEKKSVKPKTTKKEVVAPAKKTKKVAAKTPQKPVKNNDISHKTVKAHKSEVTRPKTPAKVEKSGGGSPADASKSNELPDISHLTMRQQLFVDEYLVDFNAYRAALRAGYTPASADTHACELLKHPLLKPHIDAGKADMRERTRPTRDRVLADIEIAANADINDIAQFRRHCCRHCWGIDHLYQYTPAEYEKSQELHEIRRFQILHDSKYDIGAFKAHSGDWYKKNREPNEECPECHGEGKSEVFFNDTRHLSRAGIIMYAGAEVGKDGIKVKSESKKSYIEMLAKHHKIFEDKVGGDNHFHFDAAELEARFMEKMQASRTRMSGVKKDRTGG